MLRSITTLLMTGLVALSAHGANPDPEQEAKIIVKQFVGQLKPTLVSAMQSGGPVHAVNVCAEEASIIATTLSEDTGWQVKRVSLKARNPNAKPDEFEKAVLEQFDEDRANGKAPGELNHSAYTDSEFRYLQAQVADGVCLTCHGTNISSEVKAAIHSFYPEDAATGYTAGQVRGAISLRLLLEEET